MSTGSASHTATSLQRFACLFFGASAAYAAALPYIGTITPATPPWVFGARLSRDWSQWSGDWYWCSIAVVVLCAIACVRSLFGSIAWPLLAATWLTVTLANAPRLGLTAEPFWIWMAVTWVVAGGGIVAVVVGDAAIRAAFHSQRRRMASGIFIAVAIMFVAASLSSGVLRSMPAVMGLAPIAAYFVALGLVCVLAVVLLRAAGATAVSNGGANEPVLPIRFERLDLAIAAIAGCLCFAALWAVDAIGGGHGARSLSAGEIVRLVLIVPIAEEVIFRGVLWAAIRRVSSELTTLLVTAAVFGMMHAVYRGGHNVPFPLIGGLLLGLLRSGTKSLISSIVVHMIVNGLGVMTASGVLR